MVALSRNHFIWINSVSLFVVLVGIYISNYVNNVSTQADSNKEYEYCHNTSYGIVLGLIYFSLIWILFLNLILSDIIVLKI